MKPNGFERSYRDIAPPKDGLVKTGALKTPLARSSGKIGLNCEWCGMAFETYACWAKRKQHHFCSKGCSDEWHKVPVKKTCKICGSEFITTPFNAKRIVTCSVECKRKHLDSIRQPAERKISDAQVAQIIKDVRPQRVIAEEYGISQGHVSDIKAGIRRVSNAKLNGPQGPHER